MSCFKVAALTLSVVLFNPFLPLVFAASLCVGPQATGNGTGSDWNNLKSWGSAPIAGDTWYLVDGTYDAKVISLSGTTSAQPFVVRKATAGSHGGISTGWQDGLGDGQAIFTGSVRISSSWVTFDGVRGSLSKNPSDYGFTFASGWVSYPIEVYNLSSAISDITISHTSATAPSAAQEKHFFRTNNTTKAIDRVTVSHCYGSGWENFQWATAPTGTRMVGWTTEFNMILNGWGSADFHGEDINNNYANHVDWTIRYNWFEGRQGAGATGIIVVLNGAAGPYWIYGNIFKDMRYGLAAMAGVHFNLSGGIYNNTFVNVQNNYNNAALTGGDGGCSANFQNNLIVNTNGRVDNSTTGTRSHNSYMGASTIPSQTSGQSLSADPFVDQAGGNLQLKLPSSVAAGISLAAPFNKDMFGRTRGADSKWDRGAFELDETSGTVPPMAPTNLRISP